MVSGVPSGRSPRSLTSGASGLGAVRRITAEEPREGHGCAGGVGVGTPGGCWLQPVNAGRLVAKSGSMVTRPVFAVPVPRNGAFIRSK